MTRSTSFIIRRGKALQVRYSVASRHELLTAQPVWEEVIQPGYMVIHIIKSLEE